MLKSKLCPGYEVPSSPKSLTTSFSVTGYVADLQGFYSSLVANPSYISFIEGLGTVDPDALSAFQGITTATAITDFATAITALPSPYNSIASNLYSVELSIASENGIISDGQLVGSVSSALTSVFPSISSVFASDLSIAIATGGAATPTGVIVMGAVAGAVGGLAVLL